MSSVTLSNQNPSNGNTDSTNIFDTINNDMETVAEWSIIADPSLIKLQDKEGNTPLQLAILKNQKKLANFILQKASNCFEEEDFIQLLNTKNNAGNTALHLAVKQNLDDIVSAIVDEALLDLLKEKDIDGNTALHLEVLHQEKTASQKAMFISTFLFKIKNFFGEKELSNIVNIKNKENKTPLELIETLDSNPNQEFSILGYIKEFLPS